MNAEDPARHRQKVSLGTLDRLPEVLGVPVGALFERVIRW
jgi:hypothetical protein